MVADFSSKLNFEPKQIQFIEKVYTLKTDHKTGLLLQELFKKEPDAETDEKMLKLVYGEKQYNELMEELEKAGEEKGAVNYTENMQAIVFATTAVLYNKPYEDFENSYKKYISDKYKSADVELKNKIDTVENELKVNKKAEVVNYFNEYLSSKNIDFIKYEQANINITLTVSMKSLKEQAKNFIDKIADDLNLIDTQEHKAEILVEYKQSLNVSQAITTVTNRFKAIEEEKAKQERDAELQKEIVEIAKNGDKYAEAEHVPTIEEQEENFNPFRIKNIVMKLSLTDTQYKELLQYLNEKNIKWEV